MSREPKISIVIPFYNVEKYLAECLDSVINQSFQSIEVLLVNDGSTDKSREIAKSYIRKDKRCHLLDKTHSNAGDARNLGIQYSNGEYLYFLDADDFIRLDLCECLYKKAKVDDLDIVVCRSCHLDDRTGKTAPIPWSIRDELLPPKKVFSYKDIPDDIFRIFVGWPWDKLFRREMIEKEMVRFQSLHHSNDTYFVFLSLCCAARIGIIEEELVFHRTNNLHSLAFTREDHFGCFADALNALKESLNLKSIFPLVERAFVNYAVHFADWHITHVNQYDSRLNQFKLKVANALKVLELDKVSETDMFSKGENRKRILMLGWGQKNQREFSFWRYWKYKIFSKISLGNTRKHYQAKYQDQKALFEQSRFARK